MTPRKASAKEQDDREKFVRLFTDEIADLDLFRQGETVYHVPDADGKDRTYAIPNDPPFPVALAFLKAHDGLIRAQIEHAKAKGKTQEALLGKVDAAWARLVGKPGEPEHFGAFLNLLQIRQADVTAEQLGVFGAGMTANWMATVVTRLHLARIGTDFDTFLARMLGSAITAAERPPKHAPKVPSKRRSRSPSSR